MKIIRAVNLLGDSLYLLKPIAEYRMQHPGAVFQIGVMPGFAGDLVRAQFGKFFVRDMQTLEGEANAIDLSAGRAAHEARIEMIATREHLHISECYARLLGVEVDGWQRDFSPLMGWANGARSDPTMATYTVIAPFSRSCARHAGMRPNKTPDLERWGLLIDWLRHIGHKPHVLVGPGEIWPFGGNTVTVESLPYLIKLLCGASTVITVDNGIGHIASALGCRTLILWPPVSSVDFIGPIWNKKTTLMYMRPERIRADQLLRQVQKEIFK